MNNIDKSILVISSSDKLYGTNSNFSVVLPLAPTQNNFFAYRIKSFNLPYKFFTINQNNNVIYFRENVSLTAIILPGYYDITTFTAIIASQMTAASVNSYVYTCVYNQTTDTITISSTGIFYMEFSLTTNSLAKNMGFTNNDTAPSLSVNSNFGPILTNQVLLLRSNFLSSLTNKGNFSQKKRSDIILLVPVNVSFNNIIQYNSNSDYSIQHINLVNNFLNNIDIRITDYDNNDIDLRNADVFIEIEFMYIS